jgi:predicted transcriptional regulator
VTDAADTTVKLDPDLAAELAEYAAATGRSRAELVVTALARFLADERLALARIVNGFMPFGELASSEELERIFGIMEQTHPRPSRGPVG